MSEEVEKIRVCINRSAWVYYGGMAITVFLIIQSFYSSYSSVLPLTGTFIFLCLLTTYVRELAKQFLKAIRETRESLDVTSNLVW